MKRVYSGLLWGGLLLGFIVGWPTAIGLVIGVFVVIVAFVFFRMLWRL